MLNIGGAAVVAFWLVMMALLAQRGVTPEVAAPSIESPRTGEDWMGIYLDGRKVGHAVTRVEKTPAGYSITEEMLTELTVQGSRQSISTVTRSRVDGALTLKDFEFELKSGIADMGIKGAVEGKTLKLEIDTAGRKQNMDLPLRDVPHLSSDLELYLKKEGLAVGKKFRIPFFDPSSMSQQDMELDVEALEDLKLGDRVVPVYRVREEYAGIVATAWISSELGTIKGEGPMGFTFLKETKEQALAKPEGGILAGDIIALTSVTVTGEVSDPRKVAYLKVGLSGADLTGLDITGGRQVFSDGVVTITRESLEPYVHVGLPVTGPALAEYLKPSPFVQSDDPGIMHKAEEVLAGEKDAMKAAMKLSGWVHGALRKQTSAGIPSAVEVLGNLSGDCNEHTVLYTALARSVGLPTKMDAGIVMLGGRFYYHAWPEVYVGRWVSVDPTFGQFPSDATHIRLIEGGLDRQITIAKVVGKLKARIIEYHE